MALAPPAFVKLARLGSSVGIGKAWSEADLDTALARAFEHDPVALVERFCEAQVERLRLALRRGRLAAR